MRRIALAHIAYARSGDKGVHANVGVAARCKPLFQALCLVLTEERVADYFGVDRVERFELHNVCALNFVLHGALRDPLAIDRQGKCLGQHLLEMKVEIPEELL